MVKFSDTKEEPKWSLPQNYTKLTPPQRRQVREQYIVEQGGLCAHCKVELTRDPPKPYKLNLSLFPKGFLDNPIHLHHCHNTGNTIGAVHAYCNGILWEYYGE